MECMSKPWLIGPHSAPGPLEAGLRTSGYSFPSVETGSRLSPAVRSRPVWRRSAPRRCALEGRGMRGDRRIASIRARAEKDGPGCSPRMPLPCVLPLWRAARVPWLRLIQRRCWPACPGSTTRNARRARACPGSDSRNARRARACPCLSLANAPQLIPIVRPVERFWFRLQAANNATKQMVFTLKVAAPRTRNEGHEVLEHLRR